MKMISCIVWSTVLCACVSVSPIQSPDHLTADVSIHDTEWNDLFHEPALTHWVNLGGMHNAHWLATQKNLQVEQENLKALKGHVFLPNIDIHSTLGRQRLVEGQIKPDTSNLYQGQVQVSYVLPVLGGFSGIHDLRAKKNQVEFARNQVRADHLTLSSRIVSTAIQIASLHEQMIAVQQLLRLEQRIVLIQSQQAQYGGISLDHVRLEQINQHALKERSLALQLMMVRNQHALSVLIGQAPQSSVIQIIPWNTLRVSVVVPHTVRGDVVRQRPDVKMAESLLRVMHAQADRALDSFWPNLSLSASYGWISDDAVHWMDPAHLAWAVTTSVIQPLFQGGALLAKRRAALAQCEQYEALYHQAILEAFQNVTDALHAVSFNQKVAQEGHYSAHQADAHLCMMQQKMQLGGTSVLDVLLSKKNALEAHIHYIQMQTAWYESLVSLYEALGGAWWHTDASKMGHPVQMTATLPITIRKHNS